MKPVDSVSIKAVNKEHGFFSTKVHCIDSKARESVYVVVEVVTACKTLSAAKVHVKDMCHISPMLVEENVAWEKAVVTQSRVVAKRVKPRSIELFPTAVHSFFSSLPLLSLPRDSMSLVLLETMVIINLRRYNKCWKADIVSKE
jgi:hypothetical protein